MTQFLILTSDHHGRQLLIQYLKLFVNNDENTRVRDAVFGLYDKDKAHILNQLTIQNIPTGSKITTKGISLKQFLVKTIQLFDRYSYTGIVNDNSDLVSQNIGQNFQLFHQKKILNYDDVVEVCQLKMSNLLIKQIKLTIQDTHFLNEKRILKQQSTSPKLNSNLTTPNFTSTPIDIDNEEGEEYEPQIDIIQGNQYIILIELPGVQLEEVEIYRTII